MRTTRNRVGVTPSWVRIPPSPYPALPRKSSEVSSSSEGETSQRLCGPCSCHKEPGFPENVLVEIRGVLVENMCVVGGVDADLDEQNSGESRDGYLSKYDSDGSQVWT